MKAQHLERNVAFLVDELRVAERHQAEERVYFVSAREALISRSHKEGTPTPSGQLLEGYQGRLFEFAGFEAKFQVGLSQKAQLLTKTIGRIPGHYCSQSQGETLRNNYHLKVFCDYIVM